MSILHGNRYSEAELDKWKSDSMDKVKLEKLKAMLEVYFEETNPNWNGWQDDIREIIKENT